MSEPIAIDLYCGLGGWTEGLLAEGYRVIGFDIEQHVYGKHRYPAQLVVQDVLTLHGSQFKEAALIVASPPCTEYSYMAMPWRRAKQIQRALRCEGDFPDNYKGSRTIADLNRLFDACFRIQREACEAAGRHVPMVVENVKGAQPWVGRANWNHSSFYLWGDVPALMPIIPSREVLKQGITHRSDGSTNFHGIKQPGNSAPRMWNERDIPRLNDGVKLPSGTGRSPAPGKGVRFTSQDCGLEAVAADNGTKIGGDWFSDPNSTCRKHGSKSNGRKMASAMIAKIPLTLSRHIAKTYRPK